MKTFSINTLGCKVNQYESQQIRLFLERLGLKQPQKAQRPELIVINTCCVTATASAKSRRALRKARRLNPKAIIVLAGCLPTVETCEFNFPENTFLPVKYRDTLADTLTQIVKDKGLTENPQDSPILRNTHIKTKNRPEIKHKHPSQPKQLPHLTSFIGHTRAFLKVQDGCDGFCSYCIIPKTRPFVRSRPIPEIIRQAQQLTAAGHKEIVITGVFLGAFGQKTVRRKKWPGGENKKLAELLEKMAQIPNLPRIRLSSLEPADITETLLDIFCKYTNIMPHLHLSLQSGSDKILKKMNRQYTSGEIREKIELIKQRLDRPAITADIIVGFPSETEADFQQTVDLAEQAGFAKMHIFGFSARDGTAAAAMQPRIDAGIAKKRSKILHELNKKSACQFRRQFIGRTATVLTEQSKGKIYGRAERYFPVYFNGYGKKLKANKLLKVKLLENTTGGVIGEPVMAGLTH